MNVQIIDNQSVWDSFVENSPDRSLFHNWDFLKIIEKHSGFKLLPYGIFSKNEDRLLSIFPLFMYKKFGIKLLFSQPPGSGIPYLGFLINPEYYSFKQRQKESYLNLIVDSIEKEIEIISPDYINFSFVPNIKDVRPFKWNGFTIDVEYTYLIDLSSPVDEIWSSFDRNCRREIRTAEKYNLSVRNTKDAGTFYSIMEERYRQQGLRFPFFSREYLKDILAAFPENLEMFFICDNEKIVDLVLTYEYNSRLVFWKGGVNLNKQIHSLEFFTWECIRQAKSKGLKILEIQGANTNRLCFFKSKFNPAVETNFSVTKKDFVGKISEYFYLNYLKRL